jgi:hypothetical protein
VFDVTSGDNPLSLDRTFALVKRSIVLGRRQLAVIGLLIAECCGANVALGSRDRCRDTAADSRDSIFRDPFVAVAEQARRAH